MTDCPFCTIETAPGVVMRTERLIVFADHAPIRPGHVQIVPRHHYEVFDDLPEPLAAEIVILGQRIARAQKRLYGVARVGFVFTGNDVPHVHAHVIPLHASTDVTSLRYFADPAPPIIGATRISADEMEATAAALAPLCQPGVT